MYVCMNIQETLAISGKLLTCSLYVFKFFYLLKMQIGKWINLRGFKIFISGTSLVVQWLRLHVSTARGMGSSPGWGTKILHPTKYSQKIFFTSDFLQVGPSLEDWGTTGPYRVVTAQRLPLPKTCLFPAPSLRSGWCPRSCWPLQEALGHHTVGRRTAWPGQQGLTHFGSTLTTFSEYLMFGELLLSEKQISSMVMAVNLSLKSFSRLYLAERFNLKGEGKLGFFLSNAQVAPTSGSWETLENEASLVQHSGTSSHPLIHNTHTHTHTHTHTRTHPINAWWPINVSRPGLRNPPFNCGLFWRHHVASCLWEVSPGRKWLQCPPLSNQGWNSAASQPTTREQLSGMRGCPGLVLSVPWPPWGMQSACRILNTILPEPGSMVLQGTAFPTYAQWRCGGSTWFARMSPPGCGSAGSLLPGWSHLPWSAPVPPHHGPGQCQPASPWPGEKWTVIPCVEGDNSKLADF